MFGWNKVPEVAINLQVEIAKQHVLLTEPITGNIFISCADRIDIQKLVISVEGYYCTYEPLRNGTFQETKTRFYNTNKITVAELPKSVISLPAETHTIQFVHPPLFISHLTPTCFLPDRIKVFWVLVAELSFPKRSTITSIKEFGLHVGPELAHLNAPPSLVQAKQTFFTHSPIHYSVSVPRSIYAPGETIPISLCVKNLANMSVIKMKFDLHQKWECSRRTDLFSLYRVEVVSPPIFPILPKEEKTQVIQFPLPPRLAPTLPKRIHKQVPVAISYKIDMEFTTSKSDTFTVSLEIAVEDNFPPRTVSSATQTFNSLNHFSAIQPNSYASLRPQSLTSPQAYQSQHPQFQTQQSKLQQPQFQQPQLQYQSQQAQLQYQSQQPQLQYQSPQPIQQLQQIQPQQQFQPQQYQSQQAQPIQYSHSPSNLYSQSPQVIPQSQISSAYQSRINPAQLQGSPSFSPVAQSPSNPQFFTKSEPILSASPTVSNSIPSVFSQAPSFNQAPSNHVQGGNQLYNSLLRNSNQNVPPPSPTPVSDLLTNSNVSEVKDIAPPQYSIPFVPLAQPAALSDMYPQLVTTPPQQQQFMY